ncbi:MAG: diguanylate cyclase [Alphaproteobacteria bacterium]
MARTTRVLIADNSLAALNEMAPQLRAGGCLALIEMSAARIRERARVDRPDVAILGPGFPPDELAAAAEELRLDPVTHRIPLLLAGRNIHAADIGEALQGRIDGLLELPILLDELHAKLAAAARLKVMRAELLRRKVTYGRYGIDGFAALALPKKQRGLRVLLVRPDDLDGAEAATPKNLSAALDKAETIEVSHAIGALLEGHHDAVVIVGTAAGDATLELCADIRRHSSLFDLPIVYLEPDAGDGSRARAFIHGASDVIVAPFEPASIRRSLDLSMRQAMMREGLRAAYQGDAHPETNDPNTGLFSLEFLHKHLDLLIEDASRWTLSLSVITCIVPGLVAVRHDMGRRAGAALQRTLADLISRLIRGEDLCACLGDHSFCIVTPENPLQATASIMDRLRGVIGHTEFSVLEVACPIKLHAELGCAEFRPGDTVESLLARAQDMALRVAA